MRQDQPFAKFASPLRCLAISPDRELLAGGLYNGEACRIGCPCVNTTQCAMLSAQMHPQGRFLATTNAKGQAFVWDLFQASSPAPAWFPGWLEQLAQMRIAENNQPIPLPPLPTSEMRKVPASDGPWKDLVEAVLAAPE